MRRLAMSGILFLSILFVIPTYGDTFTVTCQGEGPSLQHARIDADQGCINAAILRLDSEIDSESIAIESEKDTSLFSQVTRRGSYDGLTCKPENEKVTKTVDQVLIQYTCRYDLSRVKRLARPSELVKPSGPERRIVSLATTPYCTDILVRGLTSRVVPCRSNPVRLVLKDTDEAITVRAPNHLPKTIRKGELNEATTIFLDPIR